jgi:hypothetical protein
MLVVLRWGCELCNGLPFVLFSVEKPRMIATEEEMVAASTSLPFLDHFNAADCPSSRCLARLTLTIAPNSLRGVLPG